eukprot:4637313-Amphidinium_carterae.1
MGAIFRSQVVLNSERCHVVKGVHLQRVGLLVGQEDWLGVVEAADVWVAEDVTNEAIWTLCEGRVNGEHVVAACKSNKESRPLNFTDLISYYLF